MDEHMTFGSHAIPAMLRQDRTLRALLYLDRTLASWLVAAASFWASWVLWSPPSNFNAFPASFQWAGTVLASEQAWSAGIGTAAIVHCIGLMLRLRGADKGAARLLAFMGLSGEFFFWAVMSLSTLMGNHDTLFGAPAFLMLALLPLWRMCRFGWSPDV